MTLAALGRAEQPLLDAIGRRRAATDPRLVRRVARFSSLGEYGRCWFALGLGGALLDRPLRREWLRATASMMGAYGCGLVLKRLFSRPRPAPAPGQQQAISTPTQLSFPSSHATTSFAAAAAMAPVLDRSGYPLAARLLTPLAAAMTGSRVYLGVHFPSDVLAGALLGRSVARILSR